MKKFLLLLTLFCTILMGTGNATEVTIGELSGATANTYLPFNGSWKYGYSQLIYTPTEIGMAGTISSLSLWLYNSGTSTLPDYPITIYMKEVSKESFSSKTDWEVLSSSDLVYTGTLASITETSATQITFTLDAPFTYNGTGNLLIAINNTLGSYTGGIRGMAFAGETNQAVYTYNDSQGAYDPTNLSSAGFSSTYGGVLTSRLVIAMDITGSGPVVTCDKPASLDVTGVTAQEATLTWSGGGSAVYNVEYQKAGADKWTTALEATSLTTVTLQNLESNTKYNVRVNCICGENFFSGYKTANFTTAIALPYGENFDDKSALPSDWKRYSGKLIDNIVNGTDSFTTTATTGWSFQSSTTGVFESKHMYVNIWSTYLYWLVLPAVPIENDVQLSFTMALSKSSTAYTAIATTGTDDKFAVLASADNGHTWTILRQWDNAGSAYVYNDIALYGEEVVIDLSAYANQDVQIAFYGGSTVSNADNYLHIDDVLIGYVPSCLKPTDLHEVAGRTTKNTIQVGWTASSNESNWKIQYKKKSATDWGAAVDVTENPYTISGLDASTEYSIRVAAFCDPTDPSSLTDYTKPITVKTAAGVPYEQAFKASTFPSDWKRYTGKWELVQSGAELVSETSGWATVAKSNAQANGVYPDSAYHLKLTVAGADCNHWTVSPTISMEAGYQLSFYLALTQSGKTSPTAVTPGEQNDDKFIVGISQDGGESWSVLREWNNNNSQFDAINATANGQLIKIGLDAYAGKNIMLAFYGESSVANTSNNLHISELKIATIPACENSTALDVTGVTGTTATLQWDNVEGAVWQYFYTIKQDGASEPTDAQFTNNTSARSVTLTGLLETTTYSFYLRKQCGESYSDIMSREFTTEQTPISIGASSFTDDFETSCKWLSDGCSSNSNAWAWGIAAANGGTHSIYVSQDGGETNTYNKSTTSIIYAIKRFYFEETAAYVFAYDWRAKGEGSETSEYDYVRVALVPDNTELKAGTTIPSGFTYKSLPEGWIALDGGTKLYDSEAWQSKNVQVAVPTGYYKVVLIWKQDASTGYDPAGAIDNFSISKMACAAPTGLVVSSVEANSAVLAWDDFNDGSTWVYACVLDTASEPAAEAFSPIALSSVQLDSLEESTAYTFYLKKVCGNGFSETASITFQTPQLPVAVGKRFEDDFEGNSKWLLLNGELENAWVIDTAAHNGGSKALYISNDGGATHAYTNNKAAVVFATKMFSFVDADYIFQYDWIANGESTFDYIRVALVPADVELTPGTSLPTGVSTTGLPSGWIALDGGGKLNLKTDWQNFVSNEITITAGDYKLVILWRDDTSGGTNPPAGIDNFRISRVLCSMPENVRADSISTDSAFIAWHPQGQESTWLLRYKAEGDADWTALAAPLTDTVCWLGNLSSATVYNVQVASWCDPADEETISEFTNAIQFVTKCEPFAALSEDFDSLAATTSAPRVLPICWSAINTCSYSSYSYYPTAYKGATAAYSGDNYLRFYSYYPSSSLSTYDPQDQYAILPELENVAGMRIKLYARAYSTGSYYDATFTVGIMTNPADTATFVPVTTLTPTTTEYEQYIIPFENYTGTGKYVAIKMKAAAPIGSNTYGYRSVYIDDIVIEEIPNCIEPSNLSAVAEEATTTSVKLTWSHGAEQNWFLQYKKSTDTIWTLYPDSVNAVPFVLGGLEHSTAYDVRVAAWCNLSDSLAASPFSNSIQVATECDKVTSYPWSQDFDAIAATTSSPRVLPLCWSAINTCSYSSYNYYPTTYKSATYAKSGTNALRFYSYAYSSTYDPQDQYAILPEMEGVSGLRMKFSARAYSTGTSYDATFTVGVMTNPTDTATFVAIKTLCPASTAYEPFEVRFNTYAGTGKYIAIKMGKAIIGGTYYHGVHIDDIVVDELPSCLEPEGLMVKSIATDSAVLAWDAEANGAWKYAIALASADEPADEAFIATTDSFAVVKGLTDNTIYTFYLRKDCGNSVSASISIPFRTKQLPASLPYANDFETDNDWAFINGDLENAWAYGEAAHNGEGTHAIYISNDNGVTNAYTITKAAVVYAYRTFAFQDGLYIFSYDWKANGESSYDYLRVALVPDSVELVAGTALPTGVTATALPANFVALDGGSKLNVATTWQKVTTAEIAVKAGIYKVVLLWRDDTSGGTQTPAAVDNISITKVRCPKQSELTITDKTATSAKLSWKSDEEQNAWQLIYTADPEFDFATAEGIDTIEITTKPYVFANLIPDTAYTVYLRANCSDDEDEVYSPWSTITFRTAKTCQTPDEVKADSITDSSALISWYTYGQTGFNLRYSIDAVNWDTVYNVLMPYTLDSLAASTTYRVQVQAACEPEVWSSPVTTFKTECKAWSIAENGDYVEGFEKYTGASYSATGVVPDCWVTGGTSTYAAPHVVTSGTYAYVHTGTKSLNFCASANSYCYAILPEFAEALNGLQISFWTKMENASSGTLSLAYLVGDTIYAYKTFANTTTMTQYEEMLDSIPANAEYLVFLWSHSGSSYYSCCIDDIEVTTIPTCFKPTDLNISKIKAHSAKLSWKAGQEGQNAWQIAIDTAATFKPDTVELINVTDSSYTLLNLDPSTTYYVYVRANCGDEDGVSKWSNKISFKTTIPCPAPTDLKAILTPGNGAIATLAWSSEAESYTVQYSRNSSFTDSIETIVTDTFINLTGLLSDSTYYARVKADCGVVDGLSVWSAAIAFTPTDIYSLTVNDGTATNEVVPIYGYNADNFSMSQFIIPAKDLESIMWDTIQQLTFYASQANLNWGNARFEVYMAETEESSIDALGDWTKMTQVLSADSLYIQDNKMVVNLSVPYWYQGDNLVIGFKQTVKGKYGRSNWYGKAAQGASYGGYQSTGNPVVSQRNFLPKTMFIYAPGQAPACVKPRHVAISHITDSAAVAKWDAVEGATWQYALIASDTLPAEADFDSISGDSIVLSNLKDATNYVFYLRQYCGEDGTSEIIARAFTTPAHVEPIPFEDNFEGKSAWKLINGTQTNAWTIGSAANDGKALYISNDGGTSNAYTFTAPTAVYATMLLDFDEAGTYNFVYDWKANGELDEEDGPLDYLRVALAPASAELVAGAAPIANLNDSTLPADWIALDGGHALLGVTEWKHNRQAIDLAKGQYKVVLAWINDESAGNNMPAAIDNFSVKERRCYQPTQLAATNIMPSSVTLSWNDGDEAQSAWQLAYSKNADFIPDSVAALDIASNPYALGGLSEETTYYASVRVNCGDGDYSEWSAITSFTTLPHCDVFADDVVDTICAGTPYTWHGKVYTEEGVYRDTLPYASVQGCDSIITLVLSYYEPEDTIRVAFSIRQDSLPYRYKANYIEGQEQIAYMAGTEVGTYFDTVLVQGEHCAAVLIHTLTVEQIPCQTVVMDEEEATICAGDTYTWHGKSYSVSGLYYDTTQTIFGCDSVFTLHLMYFAPEDTLYAADTIYDTQLPYRYTADYITGQKPITYPEGTAVGEYVDTVMVHGVNCAAVLIHTLVIEEYIAPCEPVVAEAEYDTICSGETYIWNEMELTKAGTYVDTLTKVDGCDSIVTLYLSFYAPEDTIFVADTINESDLPYTYEADYITDQLPIEFEVGTAPGVYTETALVNGKNCAAVLSLTMTIEKAQGINDINGGDGKKVQKLIYHDVMYIIIDGEWYSTSGQKVADPRE